MSEQQKVETQKHPGATIVISSEKSEWTVNEDVIIDVAFTNGTKKDMEFSLDSPQDAISFEMLAANGKRIGCDPISVGNEVRTDIYLRSPLEPGKTWHYKAHLKDWRCPLNLKGSYTVAGVWQLGDMDWPTNSIAELIRSNQVSLTIVTAK